VTSESLAHLSNNLLYSAMAVYAGAMYCYAAELAFAPRRQADRSLATVGAAATSYDVSASVGGAPDASADSATRDAARLERSDRLGRIAVALTGLGFLLHLGAVVARGLSAGRPPWGNMFEFSTTGALAVTAVFLFLLARRDDPLLPRHDPLPALALGRRRHIVLDGVGAGAFLVRVGEDADVVEARVLDEALELGELRLGLSREADDEGRPQGYAGHPIADTREQLVVGLPVSRTAHPLQDVG